MPMYKVQGRRLVPVQEEGPAPIYNEPPGVCPDCLAQNFIGCHAKNAVKPAESQFMCKIVDKNTGVYWGDKLNGKNEYKFWDNGAVKQIISGYDRATLYPRDEAFAIWRKRDDIEISGAYGKLP